MKLIGRLALHPGILFLRLKQMVNQGIISSDCLSINVDTNYKFDHIIVISYSRSFSVCMFSMLSNKDFMRYTLNCCYSLVFMSPIPVRDIF